ncbi:hypothetical protein HUG15_09370 [Salicibibacter cibarius]|uniref:Uncharacterized protein n=1 Tax=Salicibibacter cibarius TaxID=2743000 RepID=A0A7T7CBD4_9BACI|nr:hypothetical protein HUG15_09370 [Salicibibacter cibarius]
MVHVVDQCIASGLVRPEVHAGSDGNQVRANASIHSLKKRELAPVQTIEDYLADLEEKDEQTLGASKETNDDDDQPPSSHPHGASPPMSSKNRPIMKIFMAKPFPIKPIAAPSFRMRACIEKAKDRNVPALSWS